MIFVQGAAQLTQDQVITGTTMTAIDELKCPVKINDKVHFIFRLIFRQNSALDSLKLDLTYPSNPVEISWNTKVQNVLSISNAIAVGTTLPFADISYIALLDGILVNGDNEGFLQPMCASTGILSSISCVMTTVM